VAGLQPQTLALADLQPFWPEAPGRPLEPLAEALGQRGLGRPLWVWPARPKSAPGVYWLMAGARRRLALLQLGRTTAPALVLPPDLPLAAAVCLALADNQERGWNQAETALTWHRVTGLGDAVAAEAAPILGLAQSPRLREWCLAAAELPRPALESLAAGRLDLENAARLATWDQASQLAALELFETLLPSKQKKREWLSWLEDISRRENISPARALADPDFQAARSNLAREGRPAAENNLRRLLWRRRHPLLAELTDQRTARVKALALPPSARLELDPTFEDLKFSLNLTFATRAEFQKLADLMGRLAESPVFSAILNDDIND
jgi:hypothetical protein